MTNFVNRVAELNLVEETFGDLLSKERLIRTPILNFYGVDGIGKTSMLDKVSQICDAHQVPHIHADVQQGFSEFHEKVRHQSQKFLSPLSFPSTPEKDEFDQSVKLTQSLLEKGPLVLLLDAVDVTNEKQVQGLEKMLGRLVVYNKLFVVLASQRRISFEQEKSVARKLTAHQLEPFDQPSSEEYLDSMHYPFDTSTRELIFRWTRGYPLAMREMMKAIEEGLNPSEKDGQQRLITHLVDRVVTQSLLAKVKADEKPWYQQALNLLSVPRRFNLVMMQKLIERYEPEMKLANSLAYIMLPKKIAQATPVIGWDLAKAGFAIDEPVRQLLLLYLELVHRDLYYDVNRFLAELNWLNASVDVTGLDRIRYQREYLYHIAKSAEEAQLRALLEDAAAQIVQDAEAKPEQLQAFTEELNQDEELKSILGTHITVVLGPIYRKLAQRTYQDYQKEKDEEKRFQHLNTFFYYAIHNPAEVQLGSTLREYLLRLLKEEDPVRLLAFYEQLGTSMQLQEKLGGEFGTLHALIQEQIQ